MLWLVSEAIRASFHWLPSPKWNSWAVKNCRGHQLKFILSAFNRTRLSFPQGPVRTPRPSPAPAPRWPQSCSPSAGGEQRNPRSPASPGALRRADSGVLGCLKHIPGAGGRRGCSQLCSAFLRPRCSPRASVSLSAGLPGPSSPSLPGLGHVFSLSRSHCGS